MNSVVEKFKNKFISVSGMARSQLIFETTNLNKDNSEIINLLNIDLLELHYSE
jgi:hypothetical protein